LGQLSELRGHRSFLDSGSPLDKGKSTLAAAEPADRHLHIHRRHSGGDAGNSGVSFFLPVRRTICDFCGHHRVGFRVK
jgi:hypothetical protein